MRESEQTCENIQISNCSEQCKYCRWSQVVTVYGLLNIVLVYKWNYKRSLALSAYKYIVHARLTRWTRAMMQCTSIYFEMNIFTQFYYFTTQARKHDRSARWKGKDPEKHHASKIVNAKVSSATASRITTVF